MLNKIFTQQGGNTALARSGRIARRQLVHHFLIVPQYPGNVVARQRLTTKRLFHVGKLGLFSAQELAPRWRIKKQIAHRNTGASGVRRGRYPGLHATALRHYPPPLAGVFVSIRD